MKKFLLGLLLLPAIAFASLTQPDLALLNAANLLKNAGFENGKANWTASGGTFTISSGNTTRVYGNSGGSWDSSASGQTLGSTYTVINSGGLSSQNGVGTCAIRCASGTCTHKLQVYYAGAAIAEQTIQSSTVNFPRTLVNFVFPSSGDVTLRLISVAANEPQAYIDSCYLGRADGYNVFRSAALTNATPYTPTFTGFGTPTNIEFYWSRVGGHMVIKGKFTSGTSTATEARISLPSNYVSADTTLIPTIRSVGKGVYDVPGAFEPSVLIEPSVSYMTFGIQDVSNAGLSKLNGSGTVTSGATLSFFAEIPIQGWNADVDAVQADTTSQMWSGYHGQDCSWSTTSSSYVDPSDDGSCTFTESKNINFGAVTTFGASKPGISFSARLGDTYFVCAAPALQHNTSNTTAAVKLVDDTGTVIATQEYADDTTEQTQAPVCGLWTPSTSGSHTLKLQMRTSAGTLTIISGADPVLHWTIFKASQSFPQPLIKNSVTTPSDDVQMLASAKVSAAGVVSQESGDWINGSCAITSTSTFTCTLNSGFFNGAPTCVASIAEIGSIGFITTDSTSSTVIAKTYDQTASPTAGPFFIQCMGRK